MNTFRAHWGSRLGFILAAAGSAIGLGNIWKFPYITGLNGGGLFVLIYLFCILLVGIPIFIAELYIGQQGQKNAVESFEVLDRKNSPWRVGGALGLISAFLILSFYSVIGGWVLDFEFKSLFSEFSGKSAAEIQAMLTRLHLDPIKQTIWHLLFMALTAAIVLKGVSKGLERFNKILMPTLILIILGLSVYSFSLPGFQKAIEFLFWPHSDAISPNAVLEAVGHSFFTLSLGMGAILTYGSYLNKNESLVKVAFAVALLDTVIALLSGVVIFSIVFSFDLEPGAGPGLIFSTLPTLFAQLPGGTLVSVLFFLLVAFAALTSAVSLLEVVVAYWCEKLGTNRKQTTIGVSLSVFLTGLLSVFSFNLLADFKILGFTFFDLFDRLTSSYLLPIGGMIISLFYGWRLGKLAVEKTLGPSRKVFSLGLLWITRVLAPLAILIVLYRLL